jgi:hypothetical protein
MSARAASVSAAPRPSRQLAQLAVNIGGPILVYYVLNGAGVKNLVALAAGAALPAIGSLYTLARRRTLDPVGVFMVATFSASILISVIAHSPRFLLAKDGLITGVWGLWFLASIRAHRPAAFVFARPFMEGMRIYAGRSWDALWEAEPRFRHIWWVSSALWGLGLLIDAGARVVIAYTLPVHTVPGLGGLLYPVTFVVLQIVTNVYYARAGLNQLLGARWRGRPVAGL